MSFNNLVLKSLDKLLDKDPVAVGARAAFEKLSESEQVAVCLKHGNDLIAWYTHSLLQNLINSMRARRAC